MQLAILFLLIVLVLRIYQGSKEKVSIKETVITHTDTIRIRDTIEIEKPIYISKTVIDSILIPVEKADTIFIRDTLFLQLAKEQRHYHDEEYDAWISGYQPELDSLKLYANQTHITNQYQHKTQIIQKQKRKKFGVGIQVGYGVTINDEISLNPYVGIGLSYSFLTF